MFCKNCANEMDPNAVVCVKCGVPKGQGNKYCQNCGQEISPVSTFCTSCGAVIQNQPAGYPQKSKLAAGLLGIFLGSLGVHNFYLGFQGKAIAQLLISLLSCGALAVVSSVWGLVEGIMILTGSINVDSNNVPLKD